MDKNRKRRSPASTALIVISAAQAAIALVLLLFALAYISTLQQPGLPSTSQVPVCALDVPTNIVMFFNGTSGLAPGSNTGAATHDNYTYLSDTFGTVQANVLMYGTTWIDGANSFNGTMTKWSTAWIGYSSMAYSVAAQFHDTNIMVFPGGPTTGRNVIYFALGVPPGQAAGTYTQNVFTELTC